MNRYFCLLILFYYCLINSGCKPLKLPYTTTINIIKDFDERYYFDNSSKIGFREEWNFKLLSKKEARKFGKINYTASLDSIQKFSSTIYAATRTSFDNTPELLMVFDVKNYHQLKKYLSSTFSKIDGLYDEWAYSFKKYKDKSVIMYFSNDTIQNTLNAFALIEENSEKKNYLVYYTAKYNNLNNYLKQIYIWYKERFWDTYVIKHLEDYSKRVPDSITMLYPFLSIYTIIRTINKYKSYDNLNFFDKPDSLLTMNGELSYLTAYQKLVKTFENDFFEEDKYVDLQIFWQIKAFYNCFLGQYKEAMKTEELYKIIDYKFKLKPTEQIFNASSFIMKKIAGQKIVAFNESHHDVRCRVFVLSFLDSLKKSGFTHLAIEDLDTGPYNGDVHFLSGYYCGEPLFHNLILEACKKGFKIIPYDVKSLSNKKGLYFDRDKTAAKNLYKKINLKKGDRLAIFCGYGHIDKTIDKNMPTSLIDYIERLSGIQCLTIDLAYPRLFSLKDTTINHYYVLENNQFTAVVNKKRHGNGDISVYPPTALPYFDYEYYISNNLLNYTKSTINYISDNNLDEEMLSVYVFRQRNELKKDMIALPIFTKVIKNIDQRIDLYLPSDEQYYKVVIKSANNQIKMDTSIVVGASHPEKQNNPKNMYVFFRTIK